MSTKQSQTETATLESRREIALAKLRVVRNFSGGLSAFFATERKEYVQELQRFGPYLHKTKTRFETYKTLIEQLKGDPTEPLAQRLVQSIIELVEEMRSEISKMVGLAFPEPTSDQINKFGPTPENLKIIHDQQFRKNTSRFYSVLRKQTSAAQSAFSTCDLIIYWVESLRDRSTSDNIITREISFAPEYQQAGIGILSYFSKILQTNYPDIDVGVSIQQHGDSVIMIISHPDGKREQITRTLQEYGLVVSGKLAPEELLADPIQIMALKQKLEMTHLEVKQVREILQMERAHKDGRIESLETDVKRLFGILERKLDSEAGLQDQLIKLATADGQRSTDLVNAAASLAMAIQTRDGTQIELIRDDLSVTKPDVLTRLTNFIYSSAFSGVVGNAAFSWLTALWPTLPK